MKKFIALYKAFRGGEWFGASLESIREHTDGAVVVFSEGPWMESLDLKGNCWQPLMEFRQRHPEFPVFEISRKYRDQSEQYADGLAEISLQFGPIAAVMVIDTDEIWEPEMVAKLRRTVEENPETHYFKSRLFSYLKSPTYRVWPTENPSITVALQNAGQQPLEGRFNVRSPNTKLLPDVVFHHFSYVRDDESELRSKFENTSSQESTPSDPTWWDRVWPHLPDGKNIHMTPGSESCWARMIRVTPSMLPSAMIQLGWRDTITDRLDTRWKGRLHGTSPANALIPIPTAEDRAIYEDHLLRITGHAKLDAPLLHARMKTTYLEAMWLAEFAWGIPPGGRILEIGCGSGGSTAVLAGASRNLNVTIETVDPFLAYDEQTHAGVARGVCEGNQAEFFDTAARLRYSHRLNHRAMSSEDVDDHLVGTFDLIFVDGNHSAEFVKNDLWLSWSRLKPGGLLVLHDYTTRFPDVIQEADAFSPDFATPDGTSLAVRRKGI